MKLRWLLSEIDRNNNNKLPADITTSNYQILFDDGKSGRFIAIDNVRFDDKSKSIILSR